MGAQNTAGRSSQGGGGGLPGADLTNPRSPRYAASLVGIAVRLPTDRVALAQAIVESRNEAATRSGRPHKVRLSEIVRHVFDLGMYELQIREAILRMTSRHPTFTLSEVCDHCGLPEPLVRREFAARGIELPPAGPDEAPWPARVAHVPPSNVEHEAPIALEASILVEATRAALSQDSSRRPSA